MSQKKHIYFAAFLFLLCGFVTSQVHWKQRASSPFGTLGPAFYFSSGTKIYVAKAFGGTANDTLYAWDQTTDTWSKIGAFPGTAKNSTAVEMNGKAYVICGTIATGSGFTNQVWQYDIVSNTWTQKNNFPGTAREGHSLAANQDNSKIYLSFGNYAQSSLNGYLYDLWQYDPVNDTWLQKAGFPPLANLWGRTNHRSLSSGNTLNVFWGGSDQPFSFATNNISAYSILTNSWVSTSGSFGSISSQSGISRISGALFTLGHGLFGGLGYINGSSSPINNSGFFAFSVTNTPIGFPGTARYGMLSISCNGKGYIGFGAVYNSTITPNNPYTSIPVNELWEFNPVRCVNSYSITSMNTPVALSPLINDISYATALNPAGMAITAPPLNGSATITTNGIISYTPNANFVGTDNILYNACDSLGNCDTARIYVTVNPAILVSASSTTLCGGESTTLTASLNGAGNYSWMPGGANSSTFVVTPTISTIYTVSATYSTTALTQTIFISVVPSLTLNVTASNTLLCGGQNVTLTASGASSYTWMPGNYIGDTFTASLGSTTVFSVSGSNSTGGCLTNAAIPVNVSNSSFSLSVFPSATLCGQSATISVSGTYSAYALNSTPFSGSVVVTPTSAAINYTVFASGGSTPGCSNYSVITISQGSAPAFSISTGNSQCGLCNGSVSTTVAGNASSYLYALTPGNCTTSVCQDLCPGLYNLTVTDSIGCASKKIFSIACAGPYVGIAGTTADSEGISFYPNPAVNQLFIETGLDADFTYSIYTHFGQTITGGKTNKKTAISLDGIAKGIYFVEAVTAEKTIRKKLIIE